MSDDTITLAGKSYTIKALRLRDLRTVLSTFGDAAPLGRTFPPAEAFDAGAQIVAVALNSAAGKPNFTTDMILDMEASREELSAAVLAIGQLAGLKFEPVSEDAKSGEAAAAVSTGSSSTDGSPPDAATPTPK